jgi:hypothetical protein
MVPLDSVVQYTVCPVDSVAVAVLVVVDEEEDVASFKGDSSKG